MAKRWYSVSVLSNFEKKVAEQIKQAVEDAALQEEIDEILVPTEEVIEVRRGKKVDAVRYVDSKGKGVELRRGSYKVEIAAFPIAADGTVYAVPAEKLSIKMGKKAAEKKAKDDAKNGGGTLQPVVEEAEPEFVPEERVRPGAEPTAESVFGRNDD